MFYKIGFWVLLAALLVCGWLFFSTNSMKVNGAMSWVDIYSSAPSDTIAFLEKNLNIHVTEVAKDAMYGDYTVIKTKGQMWPFAGVMATPQPGVTGTMMYLTVKDYNAASAQLKAAGAKPQVENMYAGGMLFGVYEIPGGVVIGIAQYKNVQNKAE